MKDSQCLKTGRETIAYPIQSSNILELAFQALIKNPHADIWE